MPLTKSEVQARLSEATRQFNDLKVREGEQQAALQQTADELKRLQGDFRTLNDLLDKADDTPSEDVLPQSPLEPVVEATDGEQ